MKIELKLLDQAFEDAMKKSLAMWIEANAASIREQVWSHAKDELPAAILSLSMHPINERVAVELAPWVDANQELIRQQVQECAERGAAEAVQRLCDEHLQREIRADVDPRDLFDAAVLRALHRLASSRRRKVLEDLLKVDNAKAFAALPLAAQSSALSK